MLHIDQTGSTMDDAAELIDGAQPEDVLHGSVLVAGHQTAGRGRGVGRQWIDEPGAGLLFSVVLRTPQTGPQTASLMVATALAMELEERYRLAPQVKWPNDILLRRPAVGWAKVAGILAELHAPWVVVGVGINCDQHEFRSGLQMPATSLSLHGVRTDKTALLTGLLERLARRHSGTGWLLELRARLWRRGLPVTVQTPDGRAIVGSHAGVDATGQLLLDSEAGTMRISAGRLVVSDPPVVP